LETIPERIRDTHVRWLHPVRVIIGLAFAGLAVRVIVYPMIAARAGD
jgi:hypothetical protein